MNGNYHVSSFLANERVNARRQAAEAHRQAKLAGQGSGFNIRKGAQEAVHSASLLYGRFLTILSRPRVFRTAAR